MDPNVVLGVEAGASPNEIDAAYERRRRLHDPAHQVDDGARDAAERFQAELADAYRALLGVAPPAGAATPDVGTSQGATSSRGPETRRASRPAASASSAGRDSLVVLGTLVAAYVVLQVPVAMGLGLTGLALGVFAAIALVVVVLVHERRRRA